MSSTTPRQIGIGSATLIVALALPLSAARADVFLLPGGGRLEGALANGSQSPRTTYVVKLSGGATVTLGADQVEKVIARSAAELEYDRLRHDYPDTDAGQFALAEWCKDNKLVDLQKEHLRRVVELEPNHVKARALLGYNRIGGQWRTTTEHQTALGKVMYKGQWHYPQEIEIIENKSAAEKARREWFGNIDRWRKQLMTDKAEGAKASILAIADPAAVVALSDALGKEPSEDVRRLYVEALGKIGTPDAVGILLERSLNDPADEVRYTCLDQLTGKPPQVLMTYYIQNLRSPLNDVVNRAASALQKFGDERAIMPLIDALVTTHKFKITTGSGGGMSATNSNMGSGLSMGTSTQTVTKLFENPDVLNTLVRLVPGVNYRYEVADWKQWYSGRKKNQMLDVRRN